MTNKICDKCGKKSVVSIFADNNFCLLDGKERNYVISSLDLCDECRRELKEILYNFMFKSNLPE